MAWTIFYILLLAAYIVSLALTTHQPNSVPEIIAGLSGLVALLVGLVTALQRSSLRIYFICQKLAIRFFPDTTGRWWFAARFDGQFGDDTVRSLINHFHSGEFRFKSKVEDENAYSARVEIDQTLHLKIQYDPNDLSEDGEGHVTVLSQVMEVSYGHAREKIQRQIVPVLQAITQLLKPDNSSFELDVQFLKRNPFFAVYISHLRPEQVQDYRVVLHVDGSHPSGRAEAVEITKRKVHITAKTANGFQRLAEQFVLLSPDLKMLKAGR